MKPILVHVHVHVFYPHLWEELKLCIQTIEPHPYKLFVTMVEKLPHIQEDIEKSFPNAVIEIVENRGYDIGPFIHVMNKVNLDDYSYIVKLHTKRDVRKSISFRNMYGDVWRRTLLSFIQTKDDFNRCISAFEANPKIGMQNNLNLIVFADHYDREATDGLKNFINNLKWPHLCFAFIAGSMFIARASVFSDLQNLNIDIEYFSQTNGAVHGGTIPHIFERLLGYLVYKNGMIITDGGVRSEAHIKMYQAIMHIKRKIVSFFYSDKITKSNVRTIKIFKIPVYRKKLASKDKTG